MSQKIDGSLPTNATLRSGGVSSRVSSIGSSDSSPVAATSSSDSLRLTGQATSLQSLQREMSQSPAVDNDRVQTVKNALQNGTYKVDAGNIANRMIALDGQLAA